MCVDGVRCVCTCTCTVYTLLSYTCPLVCLDTCAWSARAPRGVRGGVWCGYIQIRHTRSNLAAFGCRKLYITHIRLVL